jgi:hypothetical protein
MNREMLDALIELVFVSAMDQKDEKEGGYAFRVHMACEKLRALCAKDNAASPPPRVVFAPGAAVYTIMPVSLFGVQLPAGFLGEVVESDGHPDNLVRVSFSPYGCHWVETTRLTLAPEEMQKVDQTAALRKSLDDSLDELVKSRAESHNLRAKLDYLRAEIKALQGALNDSVTGQSMLRNERDNSRAEIKELQGKVDETHSALNDSVTVQIKYRKDIEEFKSFLANLLDASYPAGERKWPSLNLYNKAQDLRSKHGVKSPQPPPRYP